MAILSLPEAKTALNIDITDTDFDTELPDYISAAQECCDFLCGPSEAVSVTEIREGLGSISLTTTPVISITSITGMTYGTLPLTSLWLNSEAGIIKNRPLVFPIFEDVYTIVYQAGRASVPLSIKTGCKIILKHQWDTQRGTGTRTNSRFEDVTVVPGLGYAIPNRALQVMDRYLRGPAVG